VPDFALVMGVPAKIVGWMCRCAASRLEFDSNGDGVCPVCSRAYRKDGDRVTEKDAG